MVDSRLERVRCLGNNYYAGNEETHGGAEADTQSRSGVTSGERCPGPGTVKTNRGPFNAKQYFNLYILEIYRNTYIMEDPDIT